MMRFLVAVGVVLVGACGGDDDSGSTELSAYCELSAELQEIEGTPTDAQLAEIERLAPEEIADDVAVLADAVREGTGALFGTPEVQAAEERITEFEMEECGFEAPPPEDGGGAAALPTEYTGEYYQGLHEAGRPIGFRSRLTAEDGTTATLTLDEFPGQEIGPGECDGETFEDVTISAEPVPGTLEIEGFGTLELEITEVAIGFTGQGPPLCDERRGTFTGTGELEGTSGTFTAVARQPETAPDATTVTLDLED